jgi:hypothetical protein
MPLDCIGTPSRDVRTSRLHPRSLVKPNQSPMTQQLADLPSAYNLNFKCGRNTVVAVYKERTNKLQFFCFKFD